MAGFFEAVAAFKQYWEWGVLLCCMVMFKVVFNVWKKAFDEQNRMRREWHETMAGKRRDGGGGGGVGGGSGGGESKKGNESKKGSESKKDS